MNTLKKAVSVLLSFSIMITAVAGISLNANAMPVSGSCGEYATYKFDSITGELVISGTGEVYCTNFHNNESIKSVIINDGITDLGNATFYECSNLREVIIPDTVTLINTSVFRDCKSLEMITIPNSVKSICASAFANCSSLESVVIGKCVEIIEDSAFFRCVSLKNVVIPDSVMSIGEYAFYCCSSLLAVTVPKDVTSFGEGVFEGCSALQSVIIDDGVKSIGTAMFCECSNLTNVSMPNSLKIIGARAFEYCTSLTNVTIPDSVTNIYKNAFYECIKLNKVNINSIESFCNISYGNLFSNPMCYADNLYFNNQLVTDLVIPNGVEHISDFAFYNCKYLRSVTIPNSVKSVGKNAFYECSGLNKVKISDLASWCSISFADEISNPLCHAQRLYLNNTLLTELNIPVGVTSVGDYAFDNCKEITKLTIPNTVTSIGAGAFCDLSEITTVSIPDSVTEIGNDAFYSCDKLQNVKLPSKLKAINEFTFSGCDSLKTINIPNAVTYIGKSAFSRCSNLEQVIIPNNVTTICQSAFSYCWFLKNVILGTGVEKIEEEAFGWSNIENIFISNSVFEIESWAFTDVANVIYAGSSDDWNNIYIRGNNRGLDNATMHFSSVPNHVDFVQPTCNKKGSTDGYVCSHCDKSIYGCNDVDILPHKNIKTVLTRSTTSKNGNKIKKCSDCNTQISKTIIYYPKTIKLSATSYTYDGKVKKPTIKVIGSDGKVISASNYTVTYSPGLKNVGKYTVKIVFGGNYSGAVSKTFTIVPKSTTLSSLTPISKGFSVKWKKQSIQTTGYQIQIATDSKFTKGVRTYTTAKNNVVSYKISKLLAKKKYFVRVRTYRTANKVNYYSNWSASKYVTTRK